MQRALYRLTLDGNHAVHSTSLNGMRFDCHAYSRFKYGDGQIGTQYANNLADLLEHQSDIVTKERILISSSAYYRAPTAAAVIATTLTNQLQARGFTATYFRIRAYPYAGDYGAMNMRARQSLLAKKQPWISAEVSRQLQQSKVLIVDDIRVTGAREAALRPLLRHSQPLFCYVAILAPTDGTRHPEVESRLNHAYITSMARLSETISSPYFRPNARTCKYILSAAPASLAELTCAISKDRLKQLLNHMRAEGYYRLPGYRRNFTYLKFAYKKTHSR